jgi:hypothetical protein
MMRVLQVMLASFALQQQVAWGAVAADPAAVEPLLLLLA